MQSGYGGCCKPAPTFLYRGQPLLLSVQHAGFYFNDLNSSANKMPAAVKSALCFAAETYGKLEAAAAAELISAMEAKGQLIEECWS
jgi:hypothetical protein